MHVITIETPSLGDRSYLVHDGEHALVIDPQRDIDRVLAAVDAAGVEVTHVADTHLHNDYVCGGLALARTTGARYLNSASGRTDLISEDMVGRRAGWTSGLPNMTGAAIGRWTSPTLPRQMTSPSSMSDARMSAPEDTSTGRCTSRFTS